MILIISQEADKSTDEVLKYLIYWDRDFIRINREDRPISLEILLGLSNSPDELIITYKDNQFKISDISSVWYRRGSITLHGTKMPYLKKDDADIYEQYLSFYLRELKAVEAYIYERLTTVRHVNSFFDKGISKLNQFHVAVKVGLKIPRTLYCTNLEQLKRFAKGTRLIQKAIDFPIFHVSSGNKTYRCTSHSSELVEPDDIINTGTEMLLSSFQEYVEKDFELRIFYFKETFFSMAIFSQQNPKTKIDWRNYDYNNPNRLVPYKLPEIIETKIKALMKDLKLNCGSIDMIRTLQGEYVFLEVNPLGQFDWLSSNCNFFIEKTIAKYLAYGN